MGVTIICTCLETGYGFSAVGLALAFRSLLRRDSEYEGVCTALRVRSSSVECGMHTIHPYVESQRLSIIPVYNHNSDFSIPF